MTRPPFKPSIYMHFYSVKQEEEGSNGSLFFPMQDHTSEIVCYTSIPLRNVQTVIKSVWALKQIYHLRRINPL